MPAIASLEDLKAAQKDGLSIYATPLPACRRHGAMLYGFYEPRITSHVVNEACLRTIEKMELQSLLVYDMKN